MKNREAKDVQSQPIIDWLLEGDVSIQYQTYRDLLNTERPDLQARIALEGWGARLLGLRNAEGHWGERFYYPKWTSTHYTLLDLKNLAISPDTAVIRESIADVIQILKGPDGGIVHNTDARKSDVCINGLFLSYACYFGAREDDVKSIVDFLLLQHMQDGGWNCQSNRRATVHSSFHSTLSVLEGILEYRLNRYHYRLNELQAAADRSVSFLLQHRLCRSHRTGEIFDPKMLALSYPSRWRFDILRALDYIQAAGIGYDERMQDALDILVQKRRKNGVWPVQARHPGKTHFDMEKTGGPSRWNTLRALRVFRHLDQQRYCAEMTGGD